MSNLLESVQRVLDEFDGYITEADVQVIRVPLWRLESENSWVVRGSWDERDYRVANEYLERLKSGSQPPAIVLTAGGSISDGHHRIWAALRFASMGGPKTIAACSLDQIYTLLESRY